MSKFLDQLLKGKKKEELTEAEREVIIEKLVDDYISYITDSDDEELQDIFISGCFTVGSMNYYREKEIVK